MARALSGTHSVGQAPTELDRLPQAFDDPSMPGLVPRLTDPGLSAGDMPGAGVFAGLLASTESVEVPPPPPPPPPLPPLPPLPPARADADGLNFDFSSDVDLDLGSSRPVKASPGPTTTRSAATARGATDGSVQPPPSMATLPVDALAAIASLDEASGRRPAPWTGISEDALGDLEKAFDEMAVKPSAPPRRKGLTEAEERFLRGDEPTFPPGAAVGGDGPTSRREAPPRPPPRRSSKPSRARPQHLGVSDEAKRLAFVSLRAESRSDGRGTDDRSRLGRRATDRPMPPPKRAELRLERHLDVVGNRGADSEAPDLVVEQKTPPRPVPSMFAGLTLGRAVALIVLATVLGAAGGVFLTPRPQRPNTPRARAELTLAEGNKFYAEGRFDDALGKYREATRIDGTYALAHRAMGAALAKLHRDDDAANAYKLYVDLEPNALDATDAKAAMARRAPP
jgi:hypothetical protein